MMNRCKGKNKKNLRCGLSSLPGEDYCKWHCGRPLPLIPFEEHLLRLTKKAKDIHDMLRVLLDYKEDLLSPHYQKDKSAQNMVWALCELFNTYRLLMSERVR